MYCPTFLLYQTCCPLIVGYFHLSMTMEPDAPSRRKDIQSYLEISWVWGWFSLMPFLDVARFGIGFKFVIATNTVTDLVLFIGIGLSRSIRVFTNYSNPFLVFIFKGLTLIVVVLLFFLSGIFSFMFWNFCSMSKLNCWGLS